MLLRLMRISAMTQVSTKPRRESLSSNFPFPLLHSFRVKINICLHQNSPRVPAEGQCWPLGASEIQGQGRPACSSQDVLCQVLQRTGCRGLLLEGPGIFTFCEWSNSWLTLASWTWSAHLALSTGGR